MHGYQLWVELERRQVEKWASISKPQVYYSLRKLVAAGQLAAARDALRGLGLGHVALCSLAKEEELVFLPGKSRPVKLKREDPALQLLQRVRDEAHRFGITQVQRKSTATTLSSPLDAVAGIGPKRRAELVKAFGGLEGLRTASAADLQRVKGISAATAQAILAALAGDDPATDRTDPREP
jgi:excinuclease ABC subunit C